MNHSSTKIYENDIHFTTKCFKLDTDFEIILICGTKIALTFMSNFTIPECI